MEKFCLDIKKLAAKSLLYEVALSPKPGLVDGLNSGAHKDMDIYTFINSIKALEDYFYLATKVGYEFSGPDYSQLLNILRPLGLKAEEKMYKATNNVNTHKGAIFIYGLLLGAVGSLEGEKSLLSYQSILTRAGQISANILDDFSKNSLEKKVLTYGENQFLQYGYYGVRGEAKAGFPSIKIAADEIEKSIQKGFIEDIALGQGLLKLMTLVVDSNILGRRGPEALLFMKEEAQKLLDKGGYENQDNYKNILELDEIFIKKNISPGGCADLAAASLFLFWLTKR